MSLRSVHIVRKYGPFGGMERYVWELTHALRALGEPVSVICEEQLQVMPTMLIICQADQRRSKQK